MAACHSLVNVSGSVPSWLVRPARSNRGLAADRIRDATVRSPYFAPTYDQKAWPHRYGKVLRVVEIAQRRQLLAEGGVAQPHGRLGVDGTEREVLGHPLDEPQRVGQDPGRLAGVRARIGAGHVELERVDELVPEHVVGIGERSGHGQDDAPLERLGDPPGALADQPLDGVGLPEVLAHRVEDDDLPAAQVVAEEARKADRTSARPSAPRCPPPPAPPGSSTDRSDRCAGSGSRTCGTEPCSCRSTARPRPAAGTRAPTGPVSPSHAARSLGSSRSPERPAVSPRPFQVRCGSDPSVGSWELIDYGTT